nr:alpha-D-phosphohexomutase superfamily [Tanacetum cinerariifolium]
VLNEESHLAIETNGHEAAKENHWLHDGAYLMVSIHCHRIKIAMLQLGQTILIDRGLVGALEASVVKWKDWSGRGAALTPDQCSVISSLYS